MATDIVDIALAIAPAITQRTLENLRRTLEDLYIKSTQHGSTQAEQDAFNAELIAKAMLAAKLDNAKLIASWSEAIYAELLNAQTKNAAAQALQIQYTAQRDKLRHFNQELDDLQKGRTYQTLSPEARESLKARIIQAIQLTSEDVFKLSQALRSVPESGLGRTSPGGPWEASPEYGDLDGSLQNLS